MGEKELVALVQEDVNELHKAVERQDAEIKKFGALVAETKATIDKNNERIDELDLKLQRQNIPMSGIPEYEARTCNKCERKVQPSWIYCPYCGVLSPLGDKKAP